MSDRALPITTMATPGVESESRPRRPALGFRHRAGAFVINSPARVGEEVHLRALVSVGQSEPQRKRWCWRSDVVPYRPCRTIRGMLTHRLDLDVDRQPHSSQEDIAMTSAVLVLALGMSGQSPQGVYPAAQGPGKVLPAAQAPGKVSPAPQAPARLLRRPKLRPRFCRPLRLRPKSRQRPRPPARLLRRLTLRLRFCRPPRPRPKSRQLLGRLAK